MVFTRSNPKNLEFVTSFQSKYISKRNKKIFYLFYLFITRANLFSTTSSDNIFLIYKFFIFIA